MPRTKNTTATRYAEALKAAMNIGATSRHETLRLADFLEDAAADLEIQADETHGGAAARRILRKHSNRLGALADALHAELEG